eukprot:GHVR01008499.1.p2 GENE.GHVR01008499.1~~GHVR01008499.1.p2  ORF type:complete len:106 (-),score=19.15 GHVR01008499.1:118-435(-)
MPVLGTANRGARGGGEGEVQELSERTTKNNKQWSHIYIYTYGKTKIDRNTFVYATTFDPDASTKPFSSTIAKGAGPSEWASPSGHPQPCNIADLCRCRQRRPDAQ